MAVGQPLHTSALSLLTVAWTLLAGPSLGLPQQQDPEVPEFSSNGEAAASLPLSPGDILRILIPGTGGEEFSGDYEVNLEGNLEIPFFDPLPVAGLDAQQVRRKLRDILLARKFFRPELLHVNVQVLEFAPIQVNVAGNIFFPGSVLLNQQVMNGSTREAQSALLPGDNPLSCYLTRALQGAGGIKPTADVTQIQVLRGGRSIIVDLSGVFTGKQIAYLPLIAGDRVIVPDSGTFQNQLVRPSQITPAKIPLYVANLTNPGDGRTVNNNQSIIQFEYGTRLFQALIASQCTGGSLTNANRRAILVKTNRTTAEVTTIEGSVEDLLDTSTDVRNPFLMPNDAVICYDSSITNTRDIFDTLSDILSPFDLLRRIFR